MRGNALARRTWAAQPNATFWAGPRFYDRYDVHLTDFWFRDPSSFWRRRRRHCTRPKYEVCAAWIGGTQDQLDPNGTVPKEDLFRLNKNTPDLRLYNFGVGRATGSVAVDLSYFKGDEVSTVGGAPTRAEDSFGASATAVFEWPFTGGRNRSVVQYGSGAPQITPAFKFLCRSSLRAFVTWAHWSDSFRGSIASATNPNALHGSAIGVQMETWW